MSRRCLALIGLAAASCSGEAPKEPEAPRAAQPARSAPSLVATGDRLRGEVSALSGDVSGLNVRVTGMGTVVDLPTDTLFEFDRADLTPAAADNLGKAAELIRRGGPGPVAIVGHTDALGEDAYNQRLSEQRAQAVADWMGSQVGVRQRQFQVSGKGETSPVAPNAKPDGSDDPQARARNRRVELIIPNR